MAACHWIGFRFFDDETEGRVLVVVVVVVVVGCFERKIFWLEEGRG